MTDLCIYHGNCDDGFAAAWAVKQAISDVEFHAGVYQKPPPDVTGRDVIMVDFSYKRPVIEEMAKRAKSILILDHHKTAAEDLGGFPSAAHPTHVAWLPHSGVHVTFDMLRSGATLAWDHFHGKERPEFIRYIEDRDLWLKKLPDGDFFTMALRSYRQDFADWDRLVEAGPAALIAEGRAIHRYYRLRIEELKRSAYIATLQGHSIWIANAPYSMASEVAGELAERGLAFGACYFEVEQGRWQYSLRSRGDFDVSEIAKRYGGGGHRAAAGFSADHIVHATERVL